MNKAVNCFKIYFKNGLKNHSDFYAIFIILYGFLVVSCSVFFDIKRDQDFKTIKNVYLPWLIAIFLVTIAIILYTTFLYNKKNFKILKTYSLLGAKKRHMITCVLLENINIYLHSVLTGFIVICLLYNSSNIENFIEITNFYNNILIVLIAPILNTVGNYIFINREY